MAITDPATAIPALLIMAIYSYVFAGGNIVYDWAQDLAVASAVGYQTILAYEQLVRIGWTNGIAVGEWHYIIPIIAGFLIFTIASREWTWASRWPSAILLGVGLGLAMASFAYADIFMQIVPSWTIGLLPVARWEYLIIIGGMVLTFWWAIYTIPHKGPGIMPTVLDRLADVGKAFVMIYITSKWASTVMYRVVLVIGNLQRILWDWLGLSEPVFG